MVNRFEVHQIGPDEAGEGKRALEPSWVAPAMRSSRVAIAGKSSDDIAPGTENSIRKQAGL